MSWAILANRGGKCLIESRFGSPSPSSAHRASFATRMGSGAGRGRGLSGSECVVKRGRYQYFGVEVGADSQATTQRGVALTDRYNPSERQTPAPARGRQAPPAVPSRHDGRESPRRRRLTIDVSDSLHQRMKVRAAMTGVTMVEEIRAVLERHYSALAEAQRPGENLSE